MQALPKPKPPPCARSAWIRWAVIRITAHLIHALRAQGGGLGLGSACIGGGQGIAVIVKVDA